MNYFLNIRTTNKTLVSVIETNCYKGNLTVVVVVLLALMEAEEISLLPLFQPCFRIFFDLLFISIQCTVRSSIYKALGLLKINVTYINWSLIKKVLLFWSLNERLFHFLQQIFSCSTYSYEAFQGKFTRQSPCYHSTFMALLWDTPSFKQSKCPARA